MCTDSDLHQAWVTFLWGGRGKAQRTQRKRHWKLVLNLVITEIDHVRQRMVLGSMERLDSFGDFGVQFSNDLPIEAIRTLAHSVRRVEAGLGCLDPAVFWNVHQNRTSYPTAESGTAEEWCILIL